MQPLEALDLLTFWHWFILAVLLVALEIFAPGVVFLWLSIAAGLTGLILLVVPSLIWEHQFLIFAALSVASVVGGRLWVRQRPTATEHPTLNRRGEQYVGRRFTLTEPLVNGTGKLKVDDSTWRISGPDLDEGTTVTVTGVDGSTLVVEKAGKDPA